VSLATAFVLLPETIHHFAMLLVGKRTRFVFVHDLINFLADVLIVALLLLSHTRPLC
jgi:hypothetical protein